MDICAEMIAAHLEFQGKGIASLNKDTSRQERVKLLANQRSSTSVRNPLDGDSPLPDQDVEAAPSSPPSKVGAGEGSIGWGTLGLWFLVANGIMTPWTAMMAFLGIFKGAHGADILLVMNTAYFVPALPVLILTISGAVTALDRAVGTRRGYIMRVGVCQALMALVIGLFPAVGGTKPYIISASIVMGVFGGLAYGSLMQLVSVFHPKAASMYSMGQFFPGFLFLFLHLGMGFSAGTPTAAMKAAHWYFGVGWTIIGFLAFLALALSEEGAAVLQDMHDRNVAAAAAATAATAAAEEAPAPRPTSGIADWDSAAVGAARRAHQRQNICLRAYGGCHPRQFSHCCCPGRGRGASEAGESPSADEEVAVSALLRSIWMSLTSVFVSILAIVLIVNLFTAVPTSDPNLPLLLFYVKNSLDFAGRVLTLAPPLITSQWQLLVAVLVRVVLAPLFVVYAFGVLFQADPFILALVAVSSVTSGYLNTACFVQAAKAVPDAAKPLAAGMMNLSFQMSILASLGVGFAILAFL